jgi:hypothetical protein
MPKRILFRGGANTRNVDPVMVGGTILERDGSLVGDDSAARATAQRRRSSTCSSTRRSSRTGCRAAAAPPLPTRT